MRFLTLRDAAGQIAKGRSSGRPAAFKLEDATRRLWRAYWLGEFAAESLRLCLETQLPGDPPERYRPRQRDAEPELLIRLVIGNGRYIPREVANERGGIERFAAAAEIDPFLACPQFLESTFLEIEIEESAFRAWRRRRAAGSRDNGRALLRQWLRRNPEALGLPAAAIHEQARQVIPQLSRRGCDEVLRKLGRRQGRPRRTQK